MDDRRIVSFAWGNEVAIRGWHVPMSIGTILVMYATARRFYVLRTATLSAWIDMPLTFFSALAIYGFSRFLLGHGWHHTYTFWITTACGVLDASVRVSRRGGRFGAAHDGQTLGE